MIDISIVIATHSKCCKIISACLLNSVKASLSQTVMHTSGVFCFCELFKHSMLFRQFDKLSELMSEQNNNQAYTAKVQKYLESGTPFVPFLGVFLTQVS